MTDLADPEILSFSAELLEHLGGLIESESDRLLALLPKPLSRELDLPEEIWLGSEAAPLRYGSPLLDRLIQLATREVPVAYGQIQVPYLKKEGFQQLLRQDLIFLDSLVRVTGRAEARATYMVLICRYVAMSDERKEGLVQVGLQEGTGAVVQDFIELWDQAYPLFFPLGQVPPHFPERLDRAVSGGMHHAERQVHENLADFLKSMRRRLQRDVRNTREYYQALQAEMHAGLSHPALTDAQKVERMAKIRDLPVEMARKIEDLEQKYQVRVTVSACAAFRFLVDIVQLMVEVKHRKFKRSIPVIWNPVTRRLDPLICERCGETTTRIHPVPRENTVELLCDRCSRRKG